MQFCAYRLGDVGGTLGLFIGGSLLTFFEVIDLCVLHSPFKFAQNGRSGKGGEDKVINLFMICD